MFRRILVAVDESDQSAAALDLAIGLATTLGSSLTLIHALDPAKVAATADGGAGATIEIELDELQTAGRAVLDEATARVRAAGLSVTPIMCDGVPAATIVDTAQRNECDLIVMGTKGRHGVARIFLGSTAESVLHESTIPVLVKRT